MSRAATMWKASPARKAPASYGKLVPALLFTAVYLAAVLLVLAPHDLLLAVPAGLATGAAP